MEKLCAEQGVDVWVCPDEWGEQYLPNTEAHELFDRCWHSNIDPSGLRAFRISDSDEALKMVPGDGRRKFFDRYQEHRVIALVFRTFGPGLERLVPVSERGRGIE